MERTLVNATANTEDSKAKLDLVVSAENKLSEVYKAKKVVDNHFDIAVDSTSNVFSTTVQGKGKDAKVITKEVMIARTYDGKKAIEIHGADKIAAYNRIKYINEVAKVSTFAIPCELARIAREKLYEVGDCDSVQAYALRFFGLSKKTVNQYIRIAEYFLESGINEDGATYYRIKSPFNLYPSLTMGHFVELLAYISEHNDDGTPKKDKDGNIIQKDIDTFFTDLESKEVNLTGTTSKLREELIKKVKNVVDAKNPPKPQDGNGNGDDDNNGGDNGGDNGEDGNTGNTMTPEQLAYLESRNACSLISKNIEVYSDMWTDAKKALKLINQLMKLIKVEDSANQADQADQADQAH